MTIGQILLVDDEPDIVKSLTPALKASGSEVVVVTDDNAAISCAAVRDVDVILLDLGLHDMDGKDVIRAIRNTCVSEWTCCAKNSKPIPPTRA